VPADCLLSGAPASIDFGEVVADETGTRSVTLENGGNGTCALENVAASGAGFSASVTSLRIGPGESASFDVVFAPGDATLPLDKTGTLTFDSNDASIHLEGGETTIPLTARVKSNCTIAVDPASLDFGTVAVGSARTLAVTVSATNIGACELTAIAIGTGSDDEFTLAQGQATTLSIASGQSAEVSVTFTATAVHPPHTRTGTLVFASPDEAAPMTTVPLTANIDVGCDVTILPPALDFGNVILNTKETASVALGNDGTAACNLSGLALGAGTDPLFSLAAGQPTAYTIAVGDSVSIPVTFTASDSQPPHQRTGTLVFQSSDPRNPNGVVPLSAYINTVCVEASRYIYTVDETGMFSRFDPATLTFTDIGPLACPDDSGPNSMAVDQNAVAWVAYSSGNLYQVDTATAACQATSFVPSQDGLTVFGMGFVFSPATGKDTLYIAGGPTTQLTQSTLATIDFPSLKVTPVGVTPGLPELSGLGDGTLWGFIPSFVNPSGDAQLSQIDPSSGNTIASYTYPQADTSADSWAMKFWGGSFYIFQGTTIYRVPRDMPTTITIAVPDAGRNVVGAGVSTCAPLQ
jgi:hypothetical protein